ncbi:uncharacterized protein DC041_0006285, partial [Schistosoma bovis]
TVVFCFTNASVRSDAGAHSFSGFIYAVGGFDGEHFHNSVEMYDPRTDQWSIVAPMNSIRSGVSVTVYGHICIPSVEMMDVKDYEQ